MMRQSGFPPVLCLSGVSMLPFLMSANDAGTIAALIIISSSIILGIPVFANRGMQQLMWAGVVGFVLTVEIVLAVIVVVLISTGDISPSFS
jgi:hypothetical protein